MSFCVCFRCLFMWYFDHGVIDAQNRVNGLSFADLIISKWLINSTFRTNPSSSLPSSRKQQQNRVNMSEKQFIYRPLEYYRENPKYFARATFCTLYVATDKCRKLNECQPFLSGCKMTISNVLMMHGKINEREKHVVLGRVISSYQWRKWEKCVCITTDIEIIFIKTPKFGTFNAITSKEF